MGKVVVALLFVIGALGYALVEGPQAAQPPLFLAVLASIAALDALVHVSSSRSSD